MRSALLPLMQLPSHTSVRKDLTAAALTSQLAGLIMAVAMMAVFTAFLGKSPLYPVQVIGSFVFGDAALVGFHLPAFLTGLVLHQAGPSLLWGLVYGLLVYKAQPTTGAGFVAIGVGLGIASEMVDVMFVVPAFMNARFGHNLWAENVPRLWDWTAHVVFGASFALFPLIRDRLFPRPAA